MIKGDTPYFQAMKDAYVKGWAIPTTCHHTPEEWMDYWAKMAEWDSDPMRERPYGPGDNRRLYSYC